jgi:hypothetical protein
MKPFVICIFLLSTVYAGRNEDRFNRKVSSNSINHQVVKIIEGNSLSYLYSVQNISIIKNIKSIIKLHPKNTSVPINVTSDNPNVSIMHRKIFKNFHIIKNQNEIIEFIVAANTDDIAKIITFLNHKKPTLLQVKYRHGNDFSSSNLKTSIENNLNIKSISLKGHNIIYKHFTPSLSVSL